MQRLSSNKIHLLLIEDNPADANLVEEALDEAQLDYSLQLLDDGAAAMEFIGGLDADPSGASPDLILLDLNLPKVNGEEVLRRIRSSPKCSSAKVMVISSSDAPTDREGVMKLGVSEYFRKPSNLDQFMELGRRVRSMLESGN
jgi:two-component system, chemotaxis family, response regulator Rcp1